MECRWLRNDKPEFHQNRHRSLVDSFQIRMIDDDNDWRSTIDLPLNQCQMWCKSNLTAIFIISGPMSHFFLFLTLVHHWLMSRAKFFVNYFSLSMCVKFLWIPQLLSLKNKIFFILPLILQILFPKSEKVNLINHLRAWEGKKCHRGPFISQMFGWWIIRL